MPKRTAGGEGKKSPLNMRTTTALREKLEVAAGASGRSLVQEVEYRLERSFAEEEIRRAAPLSVETSALAADVVKAAALVEVLTGEAWTTPGRAHDAMRAALIALLEPPDTEDEASSRSALADMVMAVAGKQSTQSAEAIGRHIAVALSKPGPTMRRLVGTSAKTEDQ